MSKIKHINIDPNGLCNAKCWFCPVAYLGNPKENKGTMPIEVMESILKQIDEGRGIFVDETIQIVNNPIHYNEVLLYPYFKEMLELHRKYNIKMYLFSNGVTLTKDKTDLIFEYRDVVTDIILNIPAIDEDRWAEFSGFNKGLFKKMFENVLYANNRLKDSFVGEQLCILVNGISSKNNPETTEWLEILENAPDYKDGEHKEIVVKMKKLFPNFQVVLRNNLSDRTNILSDLKIISNQKSISKKQKGEVIGCGFNYTEEELFISATGNVYLCCADFSYESVYENIKNKTIIEIWESSERQIAIKKAYTSMCKNCFRAVWSDGVSPNLGSQQ